MPILVSVVGGYIGECFGYDLNEANSIIGAFGWLAMLTIPIGALFAIIWLALSIYNIIFFWRKRNTIRKMKI